MPHVHGFFFSPPKHNTVYVHQNHHHFSWVVLSCSLFGCCVPVPILVTPLEKLPPVSAQSLKLKIDGKCYRNPYCHLTHKKEKKSFLTADEVQNTETSAGQHVCWILAFFYTNKNSESESDSLSLLSSKERLEKGNLK